MSSMQRKSRPKGTAISESTPISISESLAFKKDKTPEERRAWRMQNIDAEIVILLECDDRRKAAEGRIDRWGF